MNMTFKEQYNTVQWQIKRMMVLAKDGAKCAKCSRTANLQVHHRCYDKTKKVWEYDNGYLEILCSYCHEREHNRRSAGSFFVQNNLRK